ncbi:MAG: hypothetical protein J1F04_03630 [Oscillospiraceae bacterium]|nr:hypothetical protein [Oscillospiraceae bacterium]
MKYMDTLKKAREAELCVQTELEHIERLHRIMKTSGKSQRYAEEIAEKLARLEAELNDSIDRTVDIKRGALSVLSALEGYERAVIYRYYILGEDWRTISEKMYLSERQVYYYRKSAIKKLEDKYNKNNRGELWRSEQESRN